MNQEQLIELLAPEWLIGQVPGADQLRPLTATSLGPGRHGDLPGWRSALSRLPALRPRCDFSGRAPQFGSAGDVDVEQRRAVERVLRGLGPWRKGPFDVLGVEVDAEWRSDLKWARVAPQLQLPAARVLDVGAGNGYTCLRLLGAGADIALGIDPALHPVMQHAALRHFAPDCRGSVLPLGLEQLPAELTGFDLVLSMGVLYHRREPHDHLRRLYTLLRPGGQLLLETLIVEGGEGDTLVPRDRYAGMRNVWCIPSPATLCGWLVHLGFREVSLRDITPTTCVEQRKTLWSSGVSLEDFLDKQSPDRTREGHPAPRRGIFTAYR
jgi:tRNA (mo5U34)-methyltransferase